MSQSCGSRFRASRGPGRGRGVSQARAVGDRGPSFETPPSPSHCPCSGQHGVLGLTSLAWECRPPHQGARPPVTALQPRAPAGVGGEGDWPARPLGCGARGGGVPPLESHDLSRGFARDGFALWSEGRAAPWPRTPTHLAFWGLMRLSSGSGRQDPRDAGQGVSQAHGYHGTCAPGRPAPGVSRCPPPNPGR